MQKTLQIINELLEKNIIESYAMAGGMAQFYYIEPSVTYDLDLIVHVSGEENTLNPLAGIYSWAREFGYKTENEHIIIEGIPVQFLLAYNDLVKEALKHRSEIIIFNEKTYILDAEYLMAIMLQTNRLSDRERFARFLAEAEYNKTLFLNILKQFNLEKEYHKFIGDKNG
ncbi:MAG: hypothetical protein L3J08_00345 [Flavobacteriaceae bacterium]|nr:hypothetical protein [Flavobacteriaceae bacterium]